MDFLIGRGPNVPAGQIQFPRRFGDQAGFLGYHQERARMLTRFITVRWRMTTIIGGRPNYTDGINEMLDEIGLEARREDIVSWISALDDDERSFTDEETVMIGRAVQISEQSLDVVDARIASIEI